MAAMTHRGVNSEITARPATAGPRIVPMLFAAPAAPMPLVRFAASVISAIYALAAGIEADLTEAWVTRAITRAINRSEPVRMPASPRYRTELNRKVPAENPNSPHSNTRLRPQASLRRPQIGLVRNTTRPDEPMMAVI